MQKIYAVMVIDHYGNSKISEEAYNTYEKAVNFIENRSDHPQKVTNFMYKSANTTYQIHELIIR